MPNFQHFVGFFAQGNYPGLTVRSEIYVGEGHGSEGIALTYLHRIAMVYPHVEREQRDGACVCAAKGGTCPKVAPFYI